VLQPLRLTSDEIGAVEQTLEAMVRERAGGTDRAALTSAINIGIGTKPGLK
jgi:hypothetical protein